MRATSVFDAFSAGRSYRCTALFFFTLILALLFFFVLLPPPARAVTYVSGSIPGGTTWNSAGSPYILTADATIPSGTTLNIEQGVVVKPYPATTLIVDGNLNASGAFFTSFKDDSLGGDTNGDGIATSPAPGDWKWIYFSPGSGSSINNCQILYGGSGGTPQNGNIYITGASPSISSTIIKHSLGNGIYVNAGSPSIIDSTISDNGSGGPGYYGVFSATRFTAFHSNTVSDNNGIAVMLPATLGIDSVYGNSLSGNQKNAMFLTGDVTVDTTFPYSESPYVLAGTTSINDNITLTIDSGVVIKPQTTSPLVVNGTLEATGATFTSFKNDAVGGDTNGDGNATSPAPGDWKWIYISAQGSGSIRDCILSYGGWGGNYYNSMIYIGGGSPTLTGNAIFYSQGNGIYVNSGSPSIHSNDIFANNNTSYGIYNYTGTVDASNNWWGGKGGPKPYGTGNGIYGPVTAHPWSDIPFTQSGAEAQAMGTDTWCGAFGEPVNTSTGAFYYDHSDLTIPTKGLPLDFRRTYNSNDAGDGPLGYGWSHNWQMSANPRSNGDVIILRGDGRRDTFIKNPDNSYTSPAGRHDTLVKNPDGTYKLTSQEQVTYNFNTENRLASVVSETGQATTLSYDVNKRLTLITEPAGRSLTLAYNAGNRIETITDPLGNTVSFGYSVTGDLTSVTDQIAGVTSFTQDSSHRIISITDPNGHAFVNNIYDAQGKVVNQTDAEGHLLTFDYSIPSQTTMTRQMDPNDPSQDETTVHHYDSALRLTIETDPYGKVTSYTYDSQGNRSATTDRRGVTTSQSFDAAGNTTDLYKAQGLPEEQHTHLTYNPKNHPLSKTDARGYMTGYTYDATGSYVTQITYPQVTNYDSSISNYSESFTYNPDGTVATSTDKNGDVTGYTYDSYGNPDVITKNTNRSIEDQVTFDYDFDALGRKTRYVDGNGKATTYEYNAIGDLRYVRTQVTNPDTGLPEDVVTEYQYDANGNRTALIDPEGKTTSYSYTPMDNLSLITDARLNTIEHTYDAAYNRTATKDRNGNWTHFGFNKNNQLISATDPENNTTTYGLDEEGNQTSSTDSVGRIVTRAFDGLGRMTSMTEPDEGGATRTTSYAYDDADNLLSTTDPAGNTYSQVYDELSRLKQASDPLSNSVYYRYDGAGNRTKMNDQRGYETSFSYSPNDLLNAVTDPLSSVTSYGYDKNGNRTSQLDAEGHTTLYAFDELNRITSEKVDAGGGNWLLEKSYRYDKAGNLTKDTTGEGSISYSYDNVYNLTGMTDRQGVSYSYSYDPAQNLTSATNSGEANTVSFTYNPRGLMATSADANGGQETFTYDAAGNLIQRNDTIDGQPFTTTYAHTPRNQLKAVTGLTGTSTASYDPAGRLAAKTAPNGITTAITYDAAGRITAQTDQKDGNTIQAFTQAFDAAGNLTSFTQAGLGTTTYTYDPLNRLTAEYIGSYGSFYYGYDRVGNRIEHSNPNSYAYYSYNQANLLIQKSENEQETTFSYDASGNLTGEQLWGEPLYTYAYNGLDRLKEATSSANGITNTYKYDALGRRIARIQGTSTRNHHQFAASDLDDYITNENGELFAALTRGTDGLATYTAFTAGGPISGYHIYNPHGDTSAITQADGSVWFDYSYDAFGNALGNEGLAYDYAGKWERERDGLTGMVQMGVRDYDPVNGRFAAVDPLRGNTVNPQSQNRYAYALNNPLTFYDLNGMTAGVAIDPGITGGAAALGASLAALPITSAAVGSLVVAAPIAVAAGFWNAEHPHDSPQDCRAGLGWDGVHYGRGNILSASNPRVANREGDDLTVGEELTEDEAAERANNGEDVYVGSREQAERIARKAGNGADPINDRAHKPGYYDHYHTGDRSGGHVFYPR